MRINMVATKNQEFKALAQIRKIVDELGEDSYLAQTFEGCFELAEVNIINDWGCSMKQRAEAAETRAVEAERKADEFVEQIVKLHEKVESLEKQAKNNLAYEDLCKIKNYVQMAWVTIGEKVREQEKRIIEYADRPTSQEFIQAVKDHRLYKEESDEVAGLMRKMNAVMY